LGQHPGTLNGKSGAKHAVVFTGQHPGDVISDNNVFATVIPGYHTLVAKTELTHCVPTGQYDLTVYPSLNVQLT